ncbi:MAG: leucine-rich repeat domain-containing protein, partial [Clostridiales bacterium]|nr:leucine-rich repeat domain-containing protein [Clostridiales bacterium]
FNGWSALESIELSHNLKYIDYEVCVNTKIKSLTIPDSVMYLADSAFRGSRALESVSAPAEMLWSFLKFSQAASYRSYIKKVNVTSGSEIYFDTFNGYSSLESVTIVENVDTIGDRAFKDLSSLTEFNYLGTTSQWEKVRKGEDWNSGSYFVVICSDSQVQ